MAIKAQSEFSSMSHFPEEELVQRMQDPRGPVSYTHLDVYKRQAFHQGVRQQAVDGGVVLGLSLIHI